MANMVDWQKIMQNVKLTTTANTDMGEVAMDTPELQRFIQQKMDYQREYERQRANVQQYGNGWGSPPPYTTGVDVAYQKESRYQVLCEKYGTPETAWRSYWSGMMPESDRLLMKEHESAERLQKYVLLPLIENLVTMVGELSDKLAKRKA